MWMMLFFFCAPSVLFCQEQKETGEIVVLPSGTVHKGDYFAFGDSVEISGTVTGDVYVMGGQVYIDGKVIGDVLVSAGSVEISGEVDNNVRAIGGQVTLSGHVGHNVTVIAGNVALSPSAVIIGNVVCLAGNGDFAAIIGSDATVISSNLRISNVIKNNLNAYVGQMRLTSKAFVGGKYRIHEQYRRHDRSPGQSSRHHFPYTFAGSRYCSCDMGPQVFGRL